MNDLDQIPEHAPRDSGDYNAKAEYQPTDDEKKALKLVDSCYKEAKHHKDKYAGEWLHYYKMFRGKQWKDARPSYRHMAVLNFIFSHIQSQVALITDSKPNFEYIATEPSDREFAEVLTEVAQADFEGNNWFVDMTEVIYDGHMYGAGLSVMDFDGDAKMSRGSVRYESFDPFYLFPDPEARNFDKRCRYVVTAVPTPTTEVKKMAPDKRDFIKSDLTTFYGFDKAQSKDQELTNPQDDTLYYQDSIGSASKERDLSLLITLYIKDDTLIEEEVLEKCDNGTESKKYVQKMKYPQGRRIRVCNKVVIEDGPNPFDDGEFPFQKWVNYMNPREFWGISEIEQLEGPQVIFNKLVSYALDVLTLTGNPVWIVDATSGVEPDEIINRPGAVIPKMPGTSVDRVDGANLQPWVQNLIQDMKGWFDELSGSQDVSQGAAERVSSAKAIIALQEAAYTRVRLKIKNLDMYLKDVGKAYRNRVLQFYDVPKVFRLTNRDGMEKFFKFHIEKTPEGKTRAIKQDIGTNALGEQVLGQRKEIILNGELDTKVSVGTSLPLAKAERKQEALELFQLGIIDEQEVLTRLDYPNKEKILERLQAKQEAMAAAQGAPA